MPLSSSNASPPPCTEPILIGPSDTRDEAPYAKRGNRKRRKASVVSSENASSPHNAEPALPTDKSSNISVCILRNIPNAVARKKSRCEEVKKQANAQRLLDARLESPNLDLH